MIQGAWFKRDWFPLLLLALYGAVFAVLAINPFNRGIWLAENFPIVAIVAILIVLYIRGVRFSNLSYLLMSVLIFMHTVGGHYTFERVPFDWFNDFFGFERNNYDWVAHFSVGFYAYPFAEILSRYSLVKNRLLLYLFPLFAIVTVAAFYEIVEWLFAVMNDPAAGGAFLGSQGDEWDAQKDMLADTLGAVTALLLYIWQSALRKI